MERFAALLERRARNFARGFTIAGGVVGAAVGALPLTPAGDIWPIPHVMGFTTLALGAAAGALVGYAASKHRAGMLRLQAQSTLCQLYSQRTSFALWLLLKNRGVEPVAATAAEPEPATTEEPLTVEPLTLEPAIAQTPEPTPAPKPEPAPPVFAPAPAPVPFAPAFALATASPEPSPPTAPLGPPPVQSPPLSHGFPPAEPQPLPAEPPVTAPSPMLGSPLVMPEVSRAQSHEPQPHEPWPGEHRLPA